MIVVDASLVLDLILVTPEARLIESRITESGGAMAAPEIIDLELLQTLRKLVRLKMIEQIRAEKALLIFENAPIERFSHRPLQARVWALRRNLTAYDAAYFALAELLSAPLWTRDAKYLSASGTSAEAVLL